MSVLSLLYDSLKNKQELRNNKDRKYFNVTSVLSCPRALYYSWNNYDKLAYDSNTMLKFKVGDKLHQLIVAEMLQAEDIRVVAAEIDMPNEKHDGIVHGRADLIVSTKEENELRVIDIKTISSYGFKALQNGTDLKEEHLLQVQFYMHYFDINKGSVLYINKDTQEMLEVEVERDDKKVLEMIERLKKLKEQFENGSNAPVPDRTNWKYNKCKYCVYRTICDIAEV